MLLIYLNISTIVAYLILVRFTYYTVFSTEDFESETESPYYIGDILI